jgi:hypothetical protein
MVKRYFDIKPFLEAVAENQPVLFPLLLSTPEEVNLKNLFSILSNVLI